MPETRSIQRWVRKSLSQEWLLILSFGGVIFLGALLLMLPISCSGDPVSFVDALFTSTSATCVTGLSVVDTGTKFTFFGQITILMLIQLGGLGITVFSIALIYIFERQLSLTRRDMLSEVLNQGPTQNLTELLKTVFLGTFAIEAIGAILLFWRFSADMPWRTALYSGIFHSISAYCNAGFSLYPDNLIRYQGDIVINSVICALIVFGGLGFVVLYEVHRLIKQRSFHLSYHSKLVIMVSILLILTGALFFFLLEKDNILKEMPWKTKILVSFFQSITTRTAGFNTVDIGLLSNPTLFLFILYMFVGGSPASCAGGIKTTTFTVILASIYARFRNQEETHFLQRKIPEDIVSKSITITFFFGLCVVLGSILLLITEENTLSISKSRGQFLELLFEVTSASGTVGLSMGITASLSVLGKILITFLMFFGRLGPLTLAAALGKQEKLSYHYATEEILVG